MIASIDKNNYNEQDLVLIKFALNIPYYQNNNSYERCDGEVEYNGVQYNYVKRKVANDTLYLYCIPNMQKTAVSKFKNICAQQIADHSTDKKAVVPVFNPFSFVFEYNIQDDTEFYFTFTDITSKQNSIYINQPVQQGFTWQPAQPPDLFI